MAMDNQSHSVARLCGMDHRAYLVEGMEMTNRTMYDAIGENIPRIPRTCQMLAYYLNGLYAANLETVAKLFPPSKYSHVPIDVNGTLASLARVLDVEKGDASPESAPDWCEDFRNTNPAWHTGGRPEIYCNRSTLPAVTAAMESAAWTVGQYYLWIATLDGTEFTGAGVNACQVWDRGLYDYSVVYDDRWLPTP